MSAFGGEAEVQVNGLYLAAAKKTDDGFDNGKFPIGKHLGVATAE
jgi:hypothetical protein